MVDIDKLAKELIELFYKEKIYSPFQQLWLIEGVIEEEQDIEYKPLAAAIHKYSQEKTTCISCGEKTDYPCHIINTKALTMFRRRNWKEISGTSRGSGHNPDKKSDKEILVEGLINTMDGFNLDDYQKENLRNNLERVRPELLVAITGSMIINQERERPMDRDVYDDGEKKLLAYLINFDPEYADWDKPNTAERLGLDKKDLMVERGLDELLPLRDRNYIKHGTIPKYKEKIDLEDYLPWWKVVNWVVKYLPEAFKGIRKILKERLPNLEHQELLHYLLQGELPIPCEKNKEWHKQMETNRRLAIGIEDKNVIPEWRKKKAESRKEGDRLIWNPIGSKDWMAWFLSAVTYFVIGSVITVVGLATYKGFYWIWLVPAFLALISWDIWLGTITRTIKKIFNSPS